MMSLLEKGIQKILEIKNGDLGKTDDKFEMLTQCCSGELVLSIEQEDERTLNQRMRQNPKFKTVRHQSSS